MVITANLINHPESLRIPLTPSSANKSLRFILYHHTGIEVLKKELTVSLATSEISGKEIFGEKIDLPAGYYFYQISAVTSGGISKPFVTDLLFEDVSATNLPGDSTVAGFSEFIFANDDAFPDIIAGLNSFTVPLKPRLLINDGNGNFTNEADQRLPATEMFVNDVAVLDVDMDGDMDIYFAVSGGVGMQNLDKLYLNDGQGFFSDVSSTHLPALPSISNNVGWGFINNDSFPDIVLSGIIFGPVQTPLFVLMNDGSGHFIDESAARLPFTKYGVFDAALTDVNRDSLADIILANIENIITDPYGNPTDTLRGENAVFIQGANGIFIDETAARMPPIDRWSKLMKITDVNNDGSPELYSINIGFDPNITRNVLYLNDGNGFFRDKTDSLMPPETITWNNDAEFKDFDLDNDLDFFMVNVVLGGAAPDVLYENNNGIFSDISSLLPPVVEFGISCTSADMDGDTDFDLFISTDSGAVGTPGLPDLLYENQLVITGISDRKKLPGEFRLFQNYPNPFNPETTIRFEIPLRGGVRGGLKQVTLIIYDILGKEVTTLVNKQLSPDSYTAHWDGKDNYGNEVASGVYIYRLKISPLRRGNMGDVLTRKMLLIR